MSKKNEHELNPETPTKELEYGGVGEYLNPDEIEVDEVGSDCFCGFEADEEVKQDEL